MKNAKERMDVIAAYRDVGTYRGAAEICGTTHKTGPAERAGRVCLLRPHNPGGRWERADVLRWWWWRRLRRWR